MVIMLTVVVRNLHANSQPDTPHEGPIHTQITCQENIFQYFLFSMGSKRRPDVIQVAREQRQRGSSVCPNDSQVVLIESERLLSAAEWFKRARGLK